MLKNLKTRIQDLNDLEYSLGMMSRKNMLLSLTHLEDRNVVYNEPLLKGVEEYNKNKFFFMKRKEIQCLSVNSHGQLILGVV